MKPPPKLLDPVSAYVPLQKSVELAPPGGGSWVGTFARLLAPAARRPSRWTDLLEAEEFRRYLAPSERLREEPDADPPGPRTQIIIDEVQNVPALIDEVHWLIENRGLRFARCGSSARKVRRGAANLLGGRALRYELHGLTGGS
ncbi:hypothetical protein MYXO_02510 [Myxococcaceae bacterium]|nr:hypothetical protein MYXO_02510 [Myxococcaceae bacterium]